MLKIGVIGCGTIGGCLIKTIGKEFKKKARLVAVCDADREKAKKAVRGFRPVPAILSVEGVIAKSDLVIEAASASISASVAQKALMSEKEVMIMSVGGLVNRKDILRLANSKKKHLYLPSGALCGLDGVKSASAAKIKEVILTTRKSPASLSNAPYLAENKINLKALKKEKVIFDGNVLDAVKGFPKNVNVSAILSLAGIGPVKTRVKIICSPGAKTNSHTVSVKGDFGQLTAKTDNLPCPGNPKTSYLAVLSAVATLKSITEYVKTGN